MYGRQSLAYSLVQPGLSYFERSEGVIGYRKRWGVTLALGNPLAAEDALPELVSAFCGAHVGPMMFAQVEGCAAEVLRACGFHVTPMGADNFVHVPSFSLRGRRMGDVRRYRNRAAAGGVVVTEAVDTPALRAELQAVSREWIRTKRVRTRELEFLDRPLATHAESDVRIFVAKVHGRLSGFVVFDPMYAQGRITGYTASILRRLPDVPMGTQDAIVLAALEVFQREGVEWLSLGVGPMDGMLQAAREHGHGVWPLYAVCAALYHMPWQPFVNIRSLSFHKSRYRPEQRPIFVATRGAVGIREMAALLRACRIV